MLGQEVKTLINKTQSAKEYSIPWNGDDNKREDLPSGIYFCELKLNGITRLTKKIIKIYR